MAERVERSTVDLSGYPDLVVIYLGMRVRKWKGLKTIFGFGPKISNSVARRPPGLLLHETVFFSPCTWGCGNTGRILRHSRHGRARSRTVSGGRSSSATPAERDSGTRHTSSAAALRLSMTMWGSLWDLCVLRRCGPPKGQCFRHGTGWACRERSRFRRRSARPTSMGRGREGRVSVVRANRSAGRPATRDSR